MKLMEKIKKIIERIPVIKILILRLYSRLSAIVFPGSEGYWIKRYKKGKDSGKGSFNKLANFKADILNDFIKRNNITSVIEFGCGDGNQLKLARYKNYIGFDISSEAINKCKNIFRSDKSKRFELLKDYKGEKADLTLSLDVIYHLIEDNIFEEHMRILFNSSNRFVIIYSSNTDEQEKWQGAHIRHRKFVQWIEENIQGWIIRQHISNEYPSKEYIETSTFADFYIFEKV